MGAEDHRQVERAIALTHTERFADRLVDTLSGGEREGLARHAAGPGSRFILLDEPLAARTWPIRWRCSPSSSS